MKLSFLLIFIMLLSGVNGQELYVFSEPASNIPAKSVAIRLTSRLPVVSVGSVKQRYLSQVMLGINKNWMVSASAGFSNIYSNSVRPEAMKLYTKWRFLSNDDLHKHFRMAAFAEAGLTRNPVLYEEVSLDGDNDGASAGLVATQLVSKLAISATAAYTWVFKDNNSLQHHANPSSNVLNYSLSAGYLLLPKAYTSYKQTNVNAYVELLGMKSLDKKHYGVDLAPAIQLIFNSNTKINVGYRFQLAGNMQRLSNRSIQLSVERTLFNAW